MSPIIKRTVLTLLILAVAGLSLLFNKTTKPGIEAPVSIPQQPIIADAELSLEESVAVLNVPESTLTRLCMVEVRYFGFDSVIHVGQLIVAKELKEEVVWLFDSICNLKFPIEKIVPMINYNWSDSLSIADNNTSCFNYRTIKGSSRLSHHAYGNAIDINPKRNPYINYRTNVREPLNATYDAKLPGTILPGTRIVKLFRDKGWKWGGNWKYCKDYQHFYKNTPTPD
jgi:peptidoglycan L-alanyl-D-glutamate endopeptidase CwlK